MYAIGINNIGGYGCAVAFGNNGLQKLHNKSVRGWLRETESMRHQVDMVFVVDDFTQKMCELGPKSLAAYVEDVAIARLK